MSFTYFDSRHFSDTEKTAVNNALCSLELAVIENQQTIRFATITSLTTHAQD